MRPPLLRRLHATAGCLGIIAAWAAASPATSAERAESTYSSIARQHCRKDVRINAEESEVVSSRVCRGKGGYVVVVEEEDLRETLTVGATEAAAREEPAAQDHFDAFNGYESNVEWRGVKGRKPFALIVGWSFADRERSPLGRPKSVEFMVVLRLPPGPVCRVAIVDRAANPAAVALARRAADELARGFKCGTDAVQILGERGRANEVVSRREEVEGQQPAPSRLTFKFARGRSVPARHLMP